MATVLIAGGSGTIGKTLMPTLVQQGYEIIILSRQPASQPIHSVQYAHWNPSKGTIDHNAIANADYIINLAGAGVADKRWTKQRKALIRSSRIKSTELLVDTILNTPNAVKAFISASASGYYGSNTLSEPAFVESNSPAQDYLAAVCTAWENALQPLSTKGIRYCILRTGIVLSKQGGAFQEFIKPFKFGLAAHLGKGTQTVSWIHEQDICGLYIHAIKQKLQGAYNAVAPYPVSNKLIVDTIRKHYKHKSIPVSIPKMILKIALGEMAEEVLKSANLSSDKVLASGYSFSFPTIDVAVEDLLNRP
jgi:uncharacterized protein (TIGR01777 family)